MSDFDSNSPLPDVEDVCPQDFMMGRVEEDSRDLFNSLQPEHLAIDLHREPLYKSATLIAPAPAPDMFASHMEAVDFPMGCGMDFFPALQKPTLTKPSLLRDSKGVQSFRLDCIPFSCTIASVEATNPPEAPFLLMDSHFETNLLADDITQKINNMLQESTEVSFEHLPAAFEWNISYLSGSSHCKLQFHIYEGQTQAFIVEANRLNGDSAPFRSLYLQLKSLILAEDVTEYSSSSVFIPSVTSPSLLSDSSDSMGLGPVLRMARQSTMEAQTESSRIICDLSVEESIRESMVEQGVVPVLRDLMLSPCSHWAQQHAALAMANISECKVGQEAIIDNGVLPVLLQLAVDGGFQDLELHRLAVFILANVSTCLAERVVTSLGHHLITVWMSSVDGMRDERLKLHAARARSSLSSVLVA